MRKTNEGRSAVGILLPAAGLGLAAILLLLLAGAMFVQRGTINESMTRPYAVFALCFGCAVSAFISAVRAPGGKFLWAAGAGMTVFVILLIGGVLLSEGPIHILKTLLSFLFAISASALGGFAGATRRKKRKY